MIQPEDLLNLRFNRNKDGTFTKMPILRFHLDFFEPTGNGCAVYSGVDMEGDPNMVCIIQSKQQLIDFWFLTTGIKL